jgi:hypothetical protein
MTCSAVSGTGYRWPRTRLHQSCQLFRSGLATPRRGEVRPPLNAVAFGVGHNPNSVPKVSETCVGSRYAMPLCIKPERGQVSENSVKPPSKESCDVLHENEFDFSSFTKLANNSSVIGPEAASFSIEASASSGEANILAGESAAYGVDGNAIGSKSGCGKRSDIIVTRDGWPVLGEHPSAELVSFTERDGSHSGSFEPEGEAADSAEKVEDIHFPPKTGLDRLGPLAL